VKCSGWQCTDVHVLARAREMAAQAPEHTNNSTAFVHSSLGWRERGDGLMHGLHCVERCRKAREGWRTRIAIVQQLVLAVNPFMKRINEWWGLNLVRRYWRARARDLALSHTGWSHQNDETGSQFPGFSGKPVTFWSENDETIRVSQSLSRQEMAAEGSWRRPLWIIPVILQRVRRNFRWRETMD
jgi:hypothetical protein